MQVVLVGGDRFFRARGDFFVSTGFGRFGTNQTVLIFVIHALM